MAAEGKAKIEKLMELYQDEVKDLKGFVMIEDHHMQELMVSVTLQHAASDGGLVSQIRFETPTTITQEDFLALLRWHVVQLKRFADQ